MLIAFLNGTLVNNDRTLKEANWQSSSNNSGGIDLILLTASKESLRL